MSPLVICEIIGAFVDTLTVNDKYPVRNCENFRSQFKRNYLKSYNFFHNFLFHFWSFYQILNILKKKNDRHS